MRTIAYYYFLTWDSGAQAALEVPGHLMVEPDATFKCHILNGASTNLRVGLKAEHAVALDLDGANNHPYLTI